MLDVMFRVIIAGSRDFSDYDLLVSSCDLLLARRKKLHFIEVVSGGARGADLLGERYAKERGFSIKRFPADWDKHGKSAGPIRNKQMGNYADALIAFPIGKSTGTRHMISVARSLELPVRYGANKTLCFKPAPQFNSL